VSRSVERDGGDCTYREIGVRIGVWGWEEEAEKGGLKEADERLRVGDSWVVSFEERDRFLYPKRTGCDSGDGSGVVGVSCRKVRRDARG